MTQALSLPADGKVQRILDLGCGTGQYTTALKERFPNAEVWGIDVGGPMVRYAHYRAVQTKIDVNFAQRLAEDTKFRDGYFDIVTDHIMFHEVTADAAKKIVAEAHRVLRPGGVFHHLDRATIGELQEPPRTVAGKANLWISYRDGAEAWVMDYALNDFPATVRNAGFDVKLMNPIARNMYPGMLGIRKA